MTVDDLDNSEIPSLNKETEIEREIPPMLIAYGEHAIAEAVAKRAGKRLETSKPVLRQRLSFFEYPSGFCYVDAYNEAKREVADVKDPAFFKVYKTILKDKTLLNLFDHYFNVNRRCDILCRLKPTAS